jgi:YVTN family beta-propeller protein
VINAATCNAANTAGCGQTPASLAVGPGPAGIVVDPATDTIYVANGGGDTVSVIDGATCNATITSGCGQTPATVTVGQSPFGMALDAANHTLYVNDAPENAVSMIDATTCNAGDTTGCVQTPPTASVGQFPVPIVADPRTDTVYVGNGNEPTVSVLDSATCNATNTTGCRAHPITLHVPGGPDGLAINEKTETLFVANNGPGTSTLLTNSVSVINAATCNAHATSGCDQPAPSVRAIRSPTATGRRSRPGDHADRRRGSESEPSTTTRNRVSVRSALEIETRRAQPQADREIEAYVGRCMIELARGLSPGDLRELAALETRALAVDGGRLKLEWQVLRARAGQDVEDVRWWEGNRLLGFLGLYAFGVPIVEMAGMVDPAARRRGIATKLLAAALPICRERGYQRALLVTPRGSAAGRAFAHHQAAVLEHSEHVLVLLDAPIEGPTDPRIALRTATSADAPELSEGSYVKRLLVRWWRAAADRRQGCRCAARCARPCRASA